MRYATTLLIIDYLNDSLIKMSSTQIIQVSMANLQLSPRPFTYEEIYEGLSDTDPYARIEGGCGGNISDSMDFLDFMVNDTRLSINVTSIAIQADKWLSGLQQDFIKVVSQGEYQSRLANKAKNILYNLSKLESLEHTQIPDLFMQLDKWIATNNERHQVIINVLNNKSFKDLSLEKEEHILANIPLSQIGDTVLKISVAAVFPNASTIIDAGSSVMQTITVLSNGSIADVRRKVTTKMAQIGPKNNTCINCLGSLLHFEHRKSVPLLNRLKKNIRSNLKYKQLIRRQLMTKVGINLPKSSIAHIEIALPNKSYDYQGPLYRFIHWFSDIEDIVFDGEINKSRNLVIPDQIKDQREYDTESTTIIYWANNLSMNEAARYVNAILDNVEINKDNLWELPTVDLEKLHNRLLSIGNLDQFEILDYRTLFNESFKVSNASFNSLSINNLNQDKLDEDELKWSRISKYKYACNLEYMLHSVRYSALSNPRLVQNIIAVYNDIKLRRKSNYTLLEKQISYHVKFGTIISFINEDIQQTIWKGDSSAYNCLYDGFKINMKIQIPSFDYDKQQCILNWNLCFQRTNEHKYSSLEEFWYGFDARFASMSSIGPKCLLSLDLPVFHEASNAKIMTEITVYKNLDNWISNSIKRFSLPDLTDNAIIKYEMPNRLIYHGRLGDIISANRWITIIPFE